MYVKKKFTQTVWVCLLFCVRGGKKKTTFLEIVGVSPIVLHIWPQAHGVDRTSSVGVCMCADQVICSAVIVHYYNFFPFTNFVHLGTPVDRELHRRMSPFLKKIKFNQCSLTLYLFASYLSCSIIASTSPSSSWLVALTALGIHMRQTNM